MKIRERIENFEDMSLVKGANLSSNSLGREIHEPLDDLRTCYMVDRDRIIHSKAFRRLKLKTQVFIKTSGDHYRTRLTHTLEVSQVARTICVCIGLNEYLGEAIALSHDLGHVAFAHIGEEVLKDFLPGGFKHNEQSVRTVKVLERDGRGLNLTKEVLDGILKHSGFSNNNANSVKEAFTLEGQVVKFSDKIAYVNHDIEDSIRAGLIKEEDIPKEISKALGHSKSQRIECLVKDCIHTTTENLKNSNLKVSLSDEVGDALTELRKFMFKNVYLGKSLKEERKKAAFVLYYVLDYYYKNPEKMPKLYLDIMQKEGKHRAVADYIAGMSDDYCINKFNKLYVPKFVVY